MRYVHAVLWLCLSSGTANAQTPSRVDFGRDVQPLFRERCHSCHGPSQQMRGLRLDRKRFAMPNRVGANGAAIVPGDSEASPVYLKLVGKRPGLAMPPDGPLTAAQINVIKRWIDEGADWPDELSGEAVASPPDPLAVQLIEILGRGDRRRFARLVRDTPAVANRKGQGGATLLMYAALYGDAEAMRLLLERGADPNARNDANASALMYAVDDPAKTRLLVEHGADVNARSDEGQTPLLIAASRPGATAVAKLLLDHGASLSTRSPGGTTPLAVAAAAGDPDLLRLLLDRGAEKDPLPLAPAVRSGCARCVELLIGFAEKRELNDALASAALFGDVETMRMLVEHGASVTSGVLTSMAQSSGTLPIAVVDTLIEAAPEINPRTPLGGTVLDLAKLQGDSPFVHALIRSGATESAASHLPVHVPRPAPSVRTAIERSLPLIDRADVAFIEKSGCISCHNNSLAFMARAAVAQVEGLAVNGEVASSQAQSVGRILAAQRERALQALGLPGRGDTAGYILLGMAAAKFAGNETTEAWARYLKNVQQTDGHWRIQAQRPPIESSDIQMTAAAVRAIQTYAPQARRDEYRQAVQSAARWLESAQPKTTEDRAFLILGLRWAGGSPQVIRRAARELLAEQRPDGGWAQLPTLESDAYATGQTLVALGESGALAAGAPAQQRAVTFLLNSQLEDGSWFVRTRTIPIQPYFDSDFPHGRDQFISAAATNWAIIALARALRDGRRQ